ncbi:RecQ family ATP-dependent DNA helicase [Lentibacillus amyloliquefaciens]|uniref:ATP-dependent DNA helicase n=1 Tax=Lentibacillus amyloliquefaciens TaxID=1472767 RepID=A0A0U4E3X7_9BACI|nr:RecQ family ATP-dependent DNA helicase [Lentibacillus amyloliquefaciens]ALX47980.1 ATP-dependent DNA helicase [Lentibacillus amyloliquefaciens]
MIKENLKKQLKQQFYIDSFREGQKEIIEDVIEGHDVLGILPTGSGKSLCYQLPATILNGLTIVVSPLISLMEDQVKQLKAAGFKDVVALNSFMRPDEKTDVFNRLDQFKLIYLSPELLQQNEVIGQLKNVRISLFVIDEAHCISQWGHEFRPDYLRLGTVLKKLNNPPLLALSATATKEVQHDIISSLEKPDIISHIYPMDRDNITFMVEKVNNDNEKRNFMMDILRKNRVPTLIYFSSKRKAEEIAAYISGQLSFQRVAFYHGDMEQIDRIIIQQQFMNGQLDIICCTSAFGMGINKRDIRLILHYHFPLQIESFLQETGRAGRDGKSSVSMLLYSPGDEHIQGSIIQNELPAKDNLTGLFNKLYDMYSKDMQLPSSSRIFETLELNEVQCRFLYYQMEKHGMMDGKALIYDSNNWKDSIRKIGHFIEKRTSFKERKLYEMLNWIHEENCLRKHLYKGFQDNYKPPLYGCCSNCGFTFEKWEPEQTETDEVVLYWEAKLKKLLLIEDYNNETK